MSGKKIPAKQDNARIARIVFLGPLGNLIYESFTMSDYDRQVRAIKKMRDNGMEHGHVKMESKRGGKITTSNGDVSYTQQHSGEYKW
jgi:hypothetical protein